MEMTATAKTVAQAEPVVDARALVRCYGQTRALDGLDLQVLPGQMVGVVGPDGAGKTTAMRILAGMMAPTSGEVTVLGQNPMGSDSALRSALGYMPQQYSLYGDLTVGENLRFFSRMFCLSRAEYDQRRERLLQITRLGPFVDRRAEALSGGMYKKLALACTLLPRPRLLLLDEPTNGVDPVSRRELWALLFEQAAEGMAVVVSTPYMDEAARCHRVGLIHRGRLLLDGSPSALLADFANPVFLAEGGAREACLRLLESHPAVLACSAAGDRLRVVVRAGAQRALQQDVARHGAALRSTSPDFEDLFLAATSNHRGGEA